MGVYIIRRLITAVVLMAIISMAVFAIFFLLPRMVGQTPEGMALRYVGPGHVTGSHPGRDRQRMHLADPIPTQYGRFVKGIFVGADYSQRPRGGALPGAVPGLLVQQQPAGLGRDHSATTGHRLAGRSARQ